MHTTQLDVHSHDHSFGLNKRSAGERRTFVVAIFTAIFMVVEISAGVLYGSMALLADGLHMGSHAIALGISVAAYIYARRYAGDERFCFGTGKVNALGGFTGALLLAGFALLMAWESVERILDPVVIVFDRALFVAVVGLVVNGVSVFILGVHEHGDHDHHDHSLHAHGHDDHAHDDHSHNDHKHSSHGHDDHNLRAAYLHVLADALTSFFAIFALLAGKFFGLNWLDPVMGIVGSLLVAHWSWGLLRDTSKVLLDHQAPTEVLEAIRAAIEHGSEDRVTDLHAWSIGPGIRSACISIVTHDPKTPEHYRALLPEKLQLVHMTIEVHKCSKPDSLEIVEIQS